MNIFSRSQWNNKSNGTAHIHTIALTTHSLDEELCFVSICYACRNQMLLLYIDRYLNVQTENREWEECKKSVSLRIQLWLIFQKPKPSNRAEYFVYDAFLFLESQTMNFTLKCRRFAFFSLLLSMGKPKDIRRFVLVDTFCQYEKGVPNTELWLSMQIEIENQNQTHLLFCSVTHASTTNS